MNLLNFSLKYILHKEIAGWEEARDHNTIHASDLTKDVEFCPREFGLLLLTGKKRPDSFISTALRTTFDNGNDSAERVRTDYLLKYVIGDWDCLWCPNVIIFSKKPDKCDNCGKDNFRYREIKFISDEYGFEGSVDILLDLPGMDKLLVTEIKTMNKDDFKKLVTPHGEHRARTSLYLALIENSEHPQRHLINQKLAVVLYIMRGFGIQDLTLQAAGLKDAKYSPYKDFLVKYDAKANYKYLEKSSRLKQFKIALKKHKITKKQEGYNHLPDKLGQCKKIEETRCRECAVSYECFNGIK